MKKNMNSQEVKARRKIAIKNARKKQDIKKILKDKQRRLKEWKEWF